MSYYCISCGSTDVYQRMFVDLNAVAGADDFEAGESIAKGCIADGDHVQCRDCGGEGTREMVTEDPRLVYATVLAEKREVKP